MSRIPLIAVVGVIAVSTSSCSDNDAKPEQFEYPLTVGSQWFYSHTLTQIAQDNGEAVVLAEGSATVTVAGIETLGDIGEAYRLEVVRTDGAMTSHGAEYYQNRDDGLHRVARCNQPGVVGPKIVAPEDVLTEHVLLFSELDLVPAQVCNTAPEIEADEPLALPYPIRIGQDWVFREIPDIGVSIHKQIMGWEKVSVPAGKLDSYRIKWTYLGNEDIEAEDHIAELGLVKRSVISKNVEITDYQNPSDPPIIADLLDELVLDSTNKRDNLAQFAYPLDVGSTWYYTRTVYTGPVDSSLELFLEEPVKVSVGAVEVLGPVGESSRLDIEQGEGHFVYRGAQFYQNRADGLYLVAHCPGGGVVTPKVSAGSDERQYPTGATFYLDLVSLETCTGTPQIESEPLLVLKYPESVGEEWHFQAVEEIGLQIRKRIVGWNQVEVPAGVFDAYQVEWIYVTGPNARILDDISADGLIRRTMVMDSIKVTTPLHPGEGREYETWMEVLTLDSLDL